VIQVVSLGFGRYLVAEPFNPAFRAGHPKMCLTVDVVDGGVATDAALYERLKRAFPGLASHACRAQGRARSPRGVVLLDGEPAANRAHLLEHLVLEALSFLDGVRRLSGVTCGYETPRERSDIFVECERPESGTLAALMAVEAMNCAVRGEPLAPRFPDMLVCARELRAHAAAPWLAAGLARATGIPKDRASAALEGLSRVDVVREEDYSVNLSGEPIYRFVGSSGARGDRE
jgi:hypothetical protein